MGKFSDWLYKYKGGYAYDDKDLRDYYTEHYLQPGQSATTAAQQAATYGNSITTSSGTLTSAQLQQMYTNSTGMGSSTYNTWDRWTKEEKKALANVGFEFHKATSSWKLKLSIDVLIPQEEGIAMLMQGTSDKPTDQMIERLKQAKEALVEKLTAKIILAELTKPREIKE